MIKRTLAPLFFIIIALIAVVINYTKPRVYVSTKADKISIKKGDSSVWAAPSYQSLTWDTTVPFKPVANWWLRKHIKISLQAPVNPTGILISLQGASEVFWDGVLIGSNGVVGTSEATEIPGTRNYYVLIPDSLLKSDNHLLALRVSSYFNKRLRSYPSIVVGDYFSLVRTYPIIAIFMHIMAGIFLVVAVYFFFIYFITYHQVSYLLFALLCLTFLALVITEYLPAYYQYPYTFHYTRLILLTSFTFLISLLLPLFLLYHYQLPYKLLITGILCAVNIGFWYFIVSYDDTNKLISLTAFTISLLIAGCAVYRNRNGSQLLFYGIFACLISHFSYDITVFIGFGILVILLLLHQSRKIRLQEQSYQQTLLRSARLEVELLKKSLGSHFLMNSLTSLMEWVERSPTASIHFIQALADEFEILNTISPNKLITVTEELALCRHHLTVMSYRKDKTFHLKAAVIDRDWQIPPAIFLTVVENWLTHTIIKENEAVFTITMDTDTVHHIFTLCGTGWPQGSLNLREGTGSRYIKARLEESYPGKWEIIQGLKEEQWVTIIKIPISHAKNTDS